MDGMIFMLQTAVSVTGMPSTIIKEMELLPMWQKAWAWPDLNTEGSGVSMGAVWADYNNDGYEDLFVYKWGKPELFKNEQGRKFTM